MQSWAATVRSVRLAAAMVATTLPQAGAVQAAGSPAPVQHVWVVMLENENYASTFTDTPAKDPYLRSLESSGVLVPNYFGIGHASLDNYVALGGGQSPAADTQADCPNYQDVTPGTAASDGQVNVAAGCVYPSSRLTIGDQLATAGLSWKGYMEDLGQDPASDGPVTCTDPGPTPVRDQTESARTTDQYANRHDPFMYFASVIGRPDYCAAHVVRLQDLKTGLVHDLQSAATTPNYSFITPNLCDDGHDTNCAAPDVSGSTAGGLVSIDHWLSAYVPKIVNSPAFRQDGMLVITFDEAGSDSSSCCSEPAGPNTASPGGSSPGPGGGQVGALVLSPFSKPGTTSSVSYNHYSLLRTTEDIFGLSGGDDMHGHLGYAGTYGDYTGPGEFGSDIFASPAPITVKLPPVPLQSLGYWLTATDGGIFPFGSARGYGSTGNVKLNKPIVGMAASADSGGYWLVASDGGIFPFGNARGFGSTGNVRLNKPIVGMAATPDGGGYWLVASDGGIFPFGDAGGYGSTGGITLNKPIVGMASTPDGGGYWLVASDGGIFPFGDAKGYGSTGNLRLNKPIVGMAATSDGGGYWLVATDGGIFPFGTARGFGSTGAMHLNRPITGMAATTDDGGYWLVATDGGIFPFGNAPGLGSTGGRHLNQPIVGMARAGG